MAAMASQCIGYPWVLQESGMLITSYYILLHLITVDVDY